MPDRRRPNLVLLVIAGIVAIAIAAVIIGSAGGDDDDDTSAGDADVEQTRPVQVSGTPLTAFDSPTNDPSVGTPSPAVEGETFAGEPITVGGEGPAVIVFVAHWCPHCQREVPFLVDYFDENGMPEGVDVYGMSTSTSSERPNYPPSEWLAREHWTVPTLVDSDLSAGAAAFGLTAFPFFVAIDEDGNVAARASGELEQPQLEALFDAARG